MFDHCPCDFQGSELGELYSEFNAATTEILSELHAEKTSATSDEPHEQDETELAETAQLAADNASTEKTKLAAHCAPIRQMLLDEYHPHTQHSC